MKVYGLTGGVGMGKSTSQQWLRSRGIAVVDTDQIARELVEPGRPALAEIAGQFGPEILDAEGRLRREELARRVFADAAMRRLLEGMLHPRIREVWQGQVKTWREEGRPMAVVVIPLLFETDAGPSFDSTICVACSAASQRVRLKSRGWSDEHIEGRIAAQWPVSRKMDLSNFVVWTEGSLNSHAAQINRIIQ
jgi:dephospho-CoA kinase